MRYCLRMSVILCCFMVAAAVLAGCSKKDEEKQAAVPKKPAATKQVKASTRSHKAVRKDKEVKLDERQRYDAYLRVKKNDIDARMDAMEKGVKRATGRTKSRLERELRDLRRKKDEVDAAYLKYNRNKDTNWQSARSDMDRSITSFDKDAVSVTSEEM